MKRNKKIGNSLLDTAINNIPFELHIPKVKKSFSFHVIYYILTLFFQKKIIQKTVSILRARH